MRAILSRLLACMDELKAACSDADRKAAVSGWSVGQHIEHVLKVNALVAGALMRPPPTDASLKPAGLIARFVILNLGYIPRGRAKTPESVAPVMADYAQLAEEVQQVRTQLASIEPHLDEFARDKALYPHPILGGFTKAQWVRFIEVHTNHHWKIVKHIRAS